MQNNIDELYKKLEELKTKCTQSEWLVFNDTMRLLIVPKQKQLEGFGKSRRLVKTVCTVASPGHLQSSQKLSNADLICLLRNNIDLIIAALKAYQPPKEEPKKNDNPTKQNTARRSTGIGPSSLRGRNVLSRN